MRNTAQSQSTATPYYKSNGVETRFYEGYFRATSNSSKLALLSDDGTSVWIDGQPILVRAGQGQGFENFNSTFYPLSKSFVAGQIYHLKLQYTNTSHINDADVDGLSLWAYDGGGDIVTLNVATTTEKTGICVGGINNAVHQTQITASVKDNNNVVLPNIPVTFTVENSHSEYPATLSAASVSTTSQGQAKTILTSSRKVGATARVTAKIATSTAQTAPITSQDAQAEWNIAPEELEADGESQANIEVSLKQGETAVAGHEVTWHINRIWNTDSIVIYEASNQSQIPEGYGSLVAKSSTTDQNGVVLATYTVGTKPGLIEFAISDHTVVANSPRTYFSKSLVLNHFTIHTFVNGAPSTFSSGKAVGTRSATRYFVDLKAAVKRLSSLGTPPPSINFLRQRFTNNQLKEAHSSTVEGQRRLAGSSSGVNTWEYVSQAPFYPVPVGNTAGWDITGLRGRWRIAVQHTNGIRPSQTHAYFKIDKREQIVLLARSWIGGGDAELRASTRTGGLCGDFAAMIYKQLGLFPANSSTVDDTFTQMEALYDLMDRDDLGNGAFLFYKDINDNNSNFNPSHVALRVGGNRINYNSNTIVFRLKMEDKDGSQMVIESEPIRAGVVTPAKGTSVSGKPVELTPYHSHIKSKTNVDLDAD